jgi:hypothetical protein
VAARLDDGVKRGFYYSIIRTKCNGPLTKQAVINWQRVHDEKGRVISKGEGLAVDGIVGPLTWKALF